MRSIEKKFQNNEKWWKFVLFSNLFSFIFQDFESYLRTEIDLVGDDIRLVWDEYHSSFVTCELQPGIYTFIDLSDVFSNIRQPEYPGSRKVIDVEFDDITMKTKFVVRLGIMAIRFDEK